MKPPWALAATVLLLSSSATCVAGQAGKAGDPEYFLEGMRVHFQTRSGRVAAVIYECYTG